MHKQNERQNRNPANATITACEIEQLFAPLAGYKHVFLAVSGGADSTALLHLADRWRRAVARPCTLHVLTVDHRLRPASVAEARAVCAMAQQLGVEATMLRPTTNPPATAIQAWAREVRYRLMCEHIAATTGKEAAALITAHHRDDLAETLLMRLARGSSVDGLAAIRPETERHGVCVLRPLLAMPKARLRAMLREGRIEWTEDPSNEAEQFERIRIRKAASVLESLGLTSEALCRTARRMAAASEALSGHAEAELRMLTKGPQLGAFGVFCWPFASRDLPEEIAIRVLTRAVYAVGGLREVPRRAKIEALLADMSQKDFSGATLGGCRIYAAGQRQDCYIFRESRRKELPHQTIQLQHRDVHFWDNRFEIVHQADTTATLTVRALSSADGDLYDRSVRHACELQVPAMIAAEVASATPIICDEHGPAVVPSLRFSRSHPAPALKVRSAFLRNRFFETQQP